MPVPVWLNGELVDPDDARVVVSDHGMTVGDGCFETLRVEQGVPFAMRRHLRRLRRSLDGLGLTCARGDAELRAAMCEVAEHLEGPGKVRLTVTGGPGPMGSARGSAEAATVYVTGAPTEPWPLTAAAVVVPWRRNEHAPTAGLKTTSYADNVVALAEANRCGADEALFANTAGHLCEGTGSNVFVVHGDVVSTPPLLSGCLAGITRELILELDPAIREAPLSLDDLHGADEVFLTSSTRDLQGLHAVDGRALAAPGPHTRRLSEAFAALVASTLDP